MKQTFNFFYPITVRYRDLDAQGHVNNAVYLTYLESARIAYYQAVGFWHPGAFPKTGMVVAHNAIDYLAPIFLGESVRVGLRTDEMGRKSLRLSFQIEKGDGTVAARGASVMVAFDNATDSSILIPVDWREKITKFDKLEK
jgi:acyl-CoA thioester hydrolase